MKKKFAESGEKKMGKIILYRDIYPFWDEKNDRRCEESFIEWCDGLTLYQSWRMSCDDGAFDSDFVQIPNASECEPIVRPSEDKGATVPSSVLKGIKDVLPDEFERNFSRSSVPRGPIGPGPRPTGPRSKGGTRTPTKKDVETMLAPYVRPSGMIATENDDEVHSWTFGIGPGPRPRGPVSADNRLSPSAPSYDPKTRYDVHGLPDD
tara:strand:- start:4 stop:624 length:621 start_codon:yes stop_codon:yes gene_type:complete